LAEQRLAEAVAEITADTGSGVVSRMHSVTRIESPAASELFPGWELTSLIFSHHVTDPDKAQGMALGLFLGFTLAVAVDGTALRLPHCGNYEEFGDLLAREGITGTTDADARRVWSVFCDLHGKGCPNEEMVRAAPSEWQLGLQRSEEWASGTETSIELYYYRLVTDVETGRVVSWKLVSEDGERRTLPYDPETGGR
jgi:hypothetical protein